MGYLFILVISKCTPKIQLVGNYPCSIVNMYKFLSKYNFIKDLFFNIIAIIRDRPFNLKWGYGFLFHSEFFFRTSQEFEYIFFLSRQARNFFQNSTLGYMTKTLNQIIYFFPPPKSEYFFQQHWESEYFFRKKPYPPSPPSS